MEDDERRAYLDVLATTPGRLRAAVKGVPKKLLTWSPAPGKWSILEIVGHLRDMEREAYLERYRRILEEDRPSLPDVDGDQLALERDYRSLRLAEVVRDWAAARKQCLQLLKRVKREQWGRVGVHETAGPLTVEQFLERQAVGNDEAHLGQIEAIKRRATLLARLESGPVSLAVACRGVSTEAARERPSPDRWAVVEHACHLRDLERVSAERLTKLAFQDRPALWALDGDRMAAIRRYREAELAAVLKEFRSLRAGTLSLLRALPTPVWQRTGRHPELGEITIERLAESLADHDDMHVAEVRGLRA